MSKVSELSYIKPLIDGLIIKHLTEFNIDNDKATIEFFAFSDNGKVIGELLNKGAFALLGELEDHVFFVYKNAEVVDFKIYNNEVHDIGKCRVIISETK